MSTTQYLLSGPAAVAVGLAALGAVVTDAGWRFIWFLLWLAATIAAVAIGGKWLVIRS